MVGKVTFSLQKHKCANKRLVIEIYLRFLTGPTQLFLISNLLVKCASYIDFLQVGMSWELFLYNLWK